MKALSEELKARVVRSANLVCTAAVFTLSTLLISSCGAPGTGAHIENGYSASDDAPDSQAAKEHTPAQDPHKIFDPETNGLLDQLHPDRSDQNDPGTAPSATPSAISPTNQQDQPTSPNGSAEPTSGADLPPHLPPPPGSIPDSTPMPTQVRTPPPTLPPTPMPTPEIMPRPTPEQTPQPTPQMTPRPTPQPTARPNVRPMPQPTPQATPRPTPQQIAKPEAPARNNTAVPTPTRGDNANNQPNQKPVTPIRGFWEGRSGEGTDWTHETVTALASYGPDLLKRIPTDITSFCPNYAALDLRGRYDFWVKFISAVAKAESDFKPSDHYQEKFNNTAGAPVISRGLLQISLESSQGYHCPISVEDDLNNPKLNIQCGVMIMEKWITEDGVIAERDAQGNWYGAARYWGVLRVTNHNFTTIEAVLQHSAGCRLGN